jgi:4-hydroxy-tetrahydrodipicolinate reductase
MNRMIQLIVHGGRGKMASRIAMLAQSDSRFEVTANVGRAGMPAGAAIRADCVIDFSVQEGVERAVEIAVERRAALLVGTTGLTAATRDLLDDAARTIPLMIAPNTSLGAAVLDRLAVFAARMLGPSWRVSITEVHHTRKRDAPSGTARRLAAALREQAGVSLADDDIESKREGDVVGDHTVRFEGTGERIEILHSAATRDIFALGALDLAAWLVKRAPGSYSVADALGLDEGARSEGAPAPLGRRRSTS